MSEFICMACGFTDSLCICGEYTFEEAVFDFIYKTESGPKTFSDVRFLLEEEFGFTSEEAALWLEGYEFQQQRSEYNSLGPTLGCE